MIDTNFYLRVYVGPGCAYRRCACVGMIDMVNWKGQLVLVFATDRQTAERCNLPTVHISGGKENLSKRQDLARAFFFLWKLRFNMYTRSLVFICCV